MTRERAKELLPVIKAWAEGRTIQRRSPGYSWADINTAYVAVDFDTPNMEWRIKPEPREWWLTAVCDHYKCWETKQEAERYGTQVIHVREVL